MGSLFTSFGVGVQGIHASQSGLNTTSHNLANTKTPGYTRQQNINADMPYQTYKVTDKHTSQIGMGTRVDAIRQIRDQFLDKEYRLEFSRQAFYDKLVETENEIEDVFGEMEGVEFRGALDDIWEQIETLSTDPGSIVYRKLFISGAEAFIDRAYDLYRELTNYQRGLNDEIVKNVKRINEIGEGIAEYNQIITQVEASGTENANDYRDARNLLMDELAGLTYYTTQEDIDGKMQIYINGAPLVIEGKSYHMHCEELSEDTGMYDVLWSDNGFGSVYDLDVAFSNQDRTDTGSLYGILTARGKSFTNYTDLPVAPKEPQETDYRNDDGTFDETGYTEAHEAYELEYAQFEKDLKVFNNTTGNSIITKIESQLDRLVHDMVCMINDVLCPNIDYDLDKISTTDINGKAVELEAGTYKILDVVNAPTGTDDDLTIGEELFKRTTTDRYQVLVLDAPLYKKDADGNDLLDEDGNRIPATLEFTGSDGQPKYKLFVYNEEQEDDIFSQYTIINLGMNEKVLASYSLLPVKVNPLAGGTGAYAQDMFTDLIANWQKETIALDPNTLTVYSFDKYYQEMVEALGTQGKIWTSMLEHQTSLADDVEAKRQQIAGVSTDEELVTLLQYQHAFNAASRYINAIDEMLQNIIERLA